MSVSVELTLTDKTYFYERWRAVGSGVVETLSGTFFLLIVIGSFHADAFIQSIVAAAQALGLLLSPILIYVARATRMPVARVCALQMSLGAMALSTFLFHPTLLSFVGGGIVALIAVTGSIPLLTQVYQQNYREEQRGGLFGSANRIKVLVVAAFSAGMGWALRDDPGQVSGYVLVVVLASLFCAYCLFRIPSEALKARPGHFPYQSMGLLVQNRKFLWLIVIWMFMGFGNLMMLPLRTVYLVDERFGFGYSPFRVALLTGVIPAVTVFLFTRMWGRLFDRINFFLLRFLLNLISVVAILFYFLVGQYWAFLLGSFLIGVAFSGGAVAWSLWVTKIAPSEQVADYMSVHTCTTGVRALIAPLISVPLIHCIPVSWIAAISVTLICISTLMLGPELTSWKKRRDGVPLTGEYRE